MNTIIYGIVEGLTEFLPISSTGHLIIAENFLHDARSEFFLVGIQAGAVLAIVLIYRLKLLDMALHLLKPANRSHSFIPFAWYRLALGLALLLWIYMR